MGNNDLSSRCKREVCRRRIGDGQSGGERTSRKMGPERDIPAPIHADIIWDKGIRDASHC